MATSNVLIVHACFETTLVFQWLFWGGFCIKTQHRFGRIGNQNPSSTALRIAF